MTSYLKSLQAGHDKRSASSRMTNVVCSSAVFPDEFQVDTSEKHGDRHHSFFNGNVATTAPGIKTEMSPTNSCRSDEIMADDQALATPAELHQVVQQVQWNSEMMKLKLFELLELAPLPFERDDQIAQALQVHERFPLAESDGPPSRPSSGGKRVNAASSKFSQHACIAIDGIFRFAFEEVSLRWNGAQNRPFSLRAYHQVAKEQIRLRDAAITLNERNNLNQRFLNQEIESLRFKVENDARHHDEIEKTLLTENRVLRRRIMDLQLRLKIDDAIPQLHEGKSTQPLIPQSAEDHQATIDPNEKHYESLNRRLTEECMLLSHTLEQRNLVVKTLSSELSTAKQQAATVKDDFRRFTQEQELLDAEFRKVFSQNEAATDAAKQECSQAKNRAAAAEGRMSHLVSEIEALSGKIELLESDRVAAVAERDHLRTRNTELVFEAERAKEELDQVTSRAAEQAELSSRKLREAHERIDELENDGTRAKLEAALIENVALNEKTKTLQRAVESRDRQIQTLRAEHKSEISKLEEAVGVAKAELDLSRAKFEELLKRERQKGLELAEAKVAETTTKFEGERKEFRAQLLNVDRTVFDLTHEIMLFHRQSTLLEKFLKDHCDKSDLRALGKTLLRRDLRNTVLEQGGESDSGHRIANLVGDGVHTPRTRLYFGRQRVFEPEDVQHRLTLTSERYDSNGAETVIPAQHERGLSSALVLKSAITEDFLKALIDRQPELPDFSCRPSKVTDSEPNETSSIFREPEEVSMAMEALKSSLVHSRLEVKALMDELLVSQHEAQSLNSAAIQTSFASAQSASGSARRAIRSAGRSRPSSAVTHRSEETSCDSPTLTAVVDVAASSIPVFSNNPQLSHPLHSTTRRQSALERVSIGDFQDSQAGAIHTLGDNEAPLPMSREFPGLQHAAEFVDLIESFYSLRRQLTALVGVCVAQAERVSLHPNDLAGAQDLLHSKFTIFRAIESDNATMLNRLHKKKEDLMRHREEELERVLAAMQNIAVTHPKESARLLHVAKSASLARQHRKLMHAEGAEQISAVVMRPRSQQSMKRLTPIPAEVVISGAPALMNLRTRASSAMPQRRQ